MTEEAKAWTWFGLTVIAIFAWCAIGEALL